MELSADFIQALDALKPPILLEKEVAYLNKAALETRIALGKAPWQKGNTLDKTRLEQNITLNKLQGSQILNNRTLTPSRMEWNQKPQLVPLADYAPGAPGVGGTHYPDFPTIPLPVIDDHIIYELEPGEDGASKIIHRVTDEEKRRCGASYPSSRPTLYCKFQGCQNPWLQHKGLISGHLMAHGLQFPKPFKCSCGADFGRQVEAFRHLEDKKPCAHCHRAGRKQKNTHICMRCYREANGNESDRPISQTQEGDS
ncbi:hypothetical protein M422DRAFT_35277 [Sphaerobolus stellatus SS14]|uniref:Unplaced genomic scaffold SPHSTscaffold_130, whole genome shotgun sequence n=1 Tax=Sphaerobolus stellatus (strain SS14) TaxID=990650 RepID=A0A0C9UXI4_SPHS4|nr:hypothetical protein M422DRAFT_35277 [Sphaerobolus stellatus SS14]